MPPSGAGPPHQRRASAFLARALRVLDSDLAAAMARLDAGESPDALHDVRVCLRKLRVTARAARPVYGRRATDPIRAACRTALRATGRQREAQVLLETLHEQPGGRPTTGKGAAPELRATVMTIRARVLELLRRPVDPDRDRPVDRLARRSVRDAARKVRRRMHPAEDDVEALHALRVAAKRLRYTVELFSTQLPASAVRLGAAAERVQARLGRVHDLDDAIQVVGSAARQSADQRRQTLKELRRRRKRELANWNRDQRALSELG